MKHFELFFCNGRSGGTSSSTLAVTSHVSATNGSDYKPFWHALKKEISNILWLSTEVERIRVNLLKG